MHYTKSLGFRSTAVGCRDCTQNVINYSSEVNIFPLHN